MQQILHDVRLDDIMDVAQLAKEIADDFVMTRRHPDDDVFLLGYTRKAQYENHWNDVTKMARGLIVRGNPLDEGAVVLSRPFAKFANVGQHGPESPFGVLPAGASFDVFEKMDGSLAIYYDLENGEGPAIATRGSFVSPQALAATRVLREQYGDFRAPRGVTPLFEFVAGWNRIVVDYGTQERLVFLAGIANDTGADVDVTTWPGARARHFGARRDFEEFLGHVAHDETDNAEGYVVRFVVDEHAPALRVKTKFSEYLRLHRLVTGVSTLSIWEALSKGDSLDELLERVPDEFDDFVRTTIASLRAQVDDLVAKAHEIAAPLVGLARRDAAAVIKAQSAVPAYLVFAVLDEKDVRAIAWKSVRPDFAQPFVSSGEND